jgi:hypothetical protein
LTALPAPQLTLLYRLEALLDVPLDFGVTPKGRRRVVSYAGGTFAGMISGELVPGGGDWQLLRDDGTASADIRYTLRTDSGALLLVYSTGVRHGDPDVLARLGRGEPVDADEYTFRTQLSIETSDAELAWLNDGVFIAVGGREPNAVVYEVYLVA